jgi:hypothetical protein
MEDFQFIDLTQHLNAVGATYDADRSGGTLNAWGNTFPAEEVPFGGELAVGGAAFRLPPKRGAHDHVESLGQVFRLPEPLPASGIALLCLGEMGDQVLHLHVSDTRARRHGFSVRARAWLVPHGSPREPDEFPCTHLHYKAGYELSLLRPSLWCRTIRWECLIEVDHILFGVNPLVHVFGMSLITG